MAGGADDTAGLDLRDLRRSFGAVTALDGVSTRVPAGRMVGLLGPNGSGKTTAMRILMGVIDADAGEVRWRGRPVDGAARRRFGYMPEERGLYPRMSGLEQVTYLARLRGVRRDRARAEAGLLLAGLGLEERMGEPVERLSLGNQQRVQLAGALVHDPGLLVLDEPFSGLDPVAVRTLSGVLRERAERGTAVLFSSHQLELVEDLCDSVTVLSAGRVVMAGEVDDLKRHSGRQVLRVAFADGGAERWVESLNGAAADVLSRDARGIRLAVPAGRSPLELLDGARSAGEVVDFGLERPNLAELFHEAVGSP